MKNSLPAPPRPEAAAQRLRAFAAIEIPAELQTAIAAQITRLKKDAGRAVRWVTPENMHLTLKFFGETSESQLGLLAQALITECSLCAPFEITISGLGCFPNPSRPRVLWVGLQAPAALAQLQASIEAAAACLGYPLEARPFSPHLTLGRVREQTHSSELQQIRAVLESQRVGNLGVFSARSVQLFRSDLKPTGPVYAPLFCAHLGQPSAFD